MVKVYYNEVTDNLGDKTIAIIGYGSRDMPMHRIYGIQDTTS